MAGLSVFLPFSVRAQGMESPSKEYVAVAAVTRSEDVETRRYAGLVVSPVSVDLVARVSGEITETPFQEGSLVQKGQLLFKLDDVNYVAAVKKLEANIEEEQARIVYAEKTYKRNSELYLKNVGSEEDRDSALSDLNAYKGALHALEASLIAAQDDLKHTRISAPISGRISVRNYTVGNYVTSSSGTLATIAQLDTVRVKFSISNRDFLTLFGSEQKLKEQGDVQIGLADGSRFGRSGRLDFIDNAANQKTDTLQIYMLFDNPDQVLIPGSTVTVYLSRNSGEKIPAVSPTAVLHDSTGAYVYVLNEKNKTARRDIVLGPERNDLQLVSSGLTVGERVVTDGTHKVVPGSEVVPVEESAH
jgi:RND family efflux transporter MFP subunit